MVSQLQREFLDFLSKRVDEGFLTEQFPSRIQKDLKIVYPECNYYFSGVNEATQYLCKRYPNKGLKISEVNRSVNRYSSGSVLNLWSDREKHRYLWSMRKDMDEADLFSNLRLVKKSQQSATKEIEFELHSFTQLIKDQILSRNSLLKVRS